MTTLASVIIETTFSALPAAGIPGRTAYTTDNNQIYYDNGATWDNVTPALTASAIAAIQQMQFVYAADTGSANAYAVALSPAPTLAAGSFVLAKILHANTGASTLAVNGGSAIAIKKQGTTALSGGELAAGQIVALVYDGTNFQLLSGASSGGSGLGTFETELITMSGTSGAFTNAPSTLIGLFKNGQKLTTLGGSAKDFSFTGTAITLTVAAISGDVYEAVYWY